MFKVYYENSKERKKANYQETTLSPHDYPTTEETPKPPVSKSPPLHADWGEAPDVSTFYGREEELNTVKHWVVQENCRLITLLGMGGIGKTTLSVKLAQQIIEMQDTRSVIWRSLRNAPPPEDILAELIQFLSKQQETILPDGVNNRILLLLKYLRSSHCLLILDNAESILLSGDRTVKLWNIRDGNCIKTLTGHTDWVRCVAFSPDGEILASSGADHKIKLWNVETGECLHTLSKHQSWVRSIAFNPSGDTLASGSGDRTIAIWNYHTGECIKTYTGHTNSVYSVAYSPDGDILVSGSGDRTVKLWDWHTGQYSKNLIGHADKICGIVFSPNGQILASASADQTCLPHPKCHIQKNKEKIVQNN